MQECKHPIIHYDIGKITKLLDFCRFWNRVEIFIKYGVKILEFVAQEDFVKNILEK